MKTLSILAILSCISLLNATVQDEIPPNEEYTPWLTGSLIAPLGTVITEGHFEIDSYVYFSSYTGSYNSKWETATSPNFFSINPQFLCTFGLTPWMDIQIIPQFYYQNYLSQNGAGFGDLPVGLDFQLYPADKEFWFPGIKLGISEIFPTGKFENLDPNKLGTDATGAGSFSTLFSLVLYKIYHLYKHHFLSVSASGTYQMPGSVNVNGANVYGGGFGTKGRVSPGNNFTGILSFELSLSQNWALALDNVWSHTDRSQFSGSAGFDENGDPFSVGAPSSEQLSFAPAIEYNFAENMGLIAGCWFTALWINSSEFRNAVMNLYYYY